MPELMPHGYTNRTVRDNMTVRKEYQGPGAQHRRGNEARVLRRLAGRLPVPPVVAESGAELKMSLMPGVHGQDLIAAGHGAQVLRACGLILRRIHGLDLRSAFGVAPPGPGLVLVHGDFGPNNVLLDADAGEVTAILDWEWAHAGDPVEDLAWCEWIVRTYHSTDLGSLDRFFDAYGARPPWAARQQAMSRRCRDLLSFCREWQRDPDSVGLWQERVRRAESWTDYS